MKQLLFLVSEDNYFYSHRLNIAKAAVAKGYCVSLATRCTFSDQRIQEAGISVIPLKYLSRSGLNPIRQILLFLELYKIYKLHRFDIVHHVALKPIIFGTLIASWLNTPKIINALGGLGFLYTDYQKPSLKKRLLRPLASRLLQFCLSRKNVITILQNPDDYETLKKQNIINQRVVIIRGAGVDIDLFAPTPFPPEPPIEITCVSRMLWTKGIQELVEAATLIKKTHPNVTINLYGIPDPQNPASIDSSIIQSWHDAKIISWRKKSDEIHRVYANSHIAVLPSYREGLPKSLLEAASCARPIVTTDVPGCREIVQHQKNGLLVPPKNSTALAKALIELIDNKVLREQMGQAGRKMIEEQFSDLIVQNQTLSLYQD